VASTITLQRTVNLAQQFLRLSPLTFTSLVALSADNGGTGYVVGDVVSVLGGLGGKASVTSIGGSGSSGPVTNLLITAAGTGYVNEVPGVATTGGSGAGLTVDVTTSNLDPGLSNADWVLQTILAPPFAWPWNRNTALPTQPTFTTKIGVTDYKVSLPTFGWIEKATGYDPDNGYKAFELLNELIVAGETLPNQPTRIAKLLEDNEGNITFRLFPPPDKIYNIVVEWQGAAQLFTSLTQTWYPIPDYLNYLVQEGFFSRAYEYFGDPRFQAAYQIFMTNLAAASEGLADTEKNIWLEPRLNIMRQTSAAQAGKR
jgi:hypothetical protein